MAVLEWVLLSALPGAGLLILWLWLDRWGRRRDPMGGSLRDHWRTTGGTARKDRERD